MADIKVEVLRKKDRISFVFETRNVSRDGLEAFDELYAAIFGSMPKDGGYLDSNRFNVDIALDDEE